MNGITININPEIIHFGGFALRWYSLAFAAGIVLAIVLVLRGAKAKGLDPDKVANVAIWAVLGGIIGARLFHVIDKFSFYQANPHHILMIYQGGLAIWGGIIVGGIVALIAARREGLPIPSLADVAVFGMIPGQIVGRIGCLINGDAAGGPTGMPWGLIYTNPGSSIPDALRGIPTHPYPIYEMLWDLGLLGILLILRRKSLPDGMLFLMYVAGYAVGRFGLTFVRQEDIFLWGLQQAQVLALAAFAAAAVGIFMLLRARAVWIIKQATAQAKSS